jgi:cation diffusion facilitator CzcD-associated flavoprotein CzcO
LIEAAGTYNRKSIPEMPGIETFKGDTWHTADWPEGYDFTGKTVAYVGTGPTSVQVLPHIQKQAKAVKVFCRSMTYCHPFVDFTYPSWIKWCFGHIPGLFALYTTIIASLFGIWAWFAFRPDSWIAKYTERYCQNVLEKQVHDPILRRKLAPTGRFGAKRPLVSLKEYFNVLQEDNVELITDAIIGIDESGLITRATLKPNDAVIDVDGYSGSDEERAVAEIFCVKADVLIWGTGFKMQGWGGAVRTVGRNGIELSEHWEDSPKTLYGKRLPACLIRPRLRLTLCPTGTMTSSFPNLFLVNGPSTVSPWASLIRGLEHQTMHNLRVIRHVHKQVTSATANYAIEPHTEKEKE